MKNLTKWCMITAMALQAPIAMAEGYQVNSLSAKQNGMGHTGTGLKLGAESMFFNPAGMAFMKDKLEFSGSVTAIFSEVEATHNGTRYTTDSDASTPMNFMLGFSVYDNLKVGIGFYTPYGSNINWGENWPGATLNQSVKLTMMTVQPTASWRILPNLAIGAGMTVTWGSVDLNKAIIMGSSLNEALQPYAPAMGQMGINIPEFPNNTMAAVNLTGNAKPRVGVNLGIMWDVTDNFTVGFDFRSRVDMKVKKGTAALSTAPEFDNFLQGVNNAVTQLPPEYQAMVQEKLGALSSLSYIDKANFSAQMPCAAVYRLGLSYKPVPALTLAFDAQLTGWKAYKMLDFEFDLPTTDFNQHIEKNYHNAWLFGLGAQYALTNRFDVRAGMIVDTTPCDKDFYNPETPGMTKIEPSVGVSFRPIPQLSIDASFLYVQGLGADGRSVGYKDMVTGAEKRFNADYKLHAFCPAIGFSYHF